MLPVSLCFPPLSDLFSFCFIPSFISSSNYWVCGGDFSIFNLLNALTQTLRVCLHTCCSLCTVAADMVHMDELREKHVSGFNTLRVIDLLCTKRAYYTVCVCILRMIWRHVCIIHGCISAGLVTLVQGNMAAVDACTHAHTRISFHNGLNKRIL